MTIDRAFEVYRHMLVHTEIQLLIPNPPPSEEFIISVFRNLLDGLESLRKTIDK